MTLEDELNAWTHRLMPKLPLTWYPVVREHVVGIDENSSCVVQSEEPHIVRYSSIRIPYIATRID